MKDESGLYYARIIIYKEGIREYMFAYVSKSIFAHLSITINKQFALVTLLEWVFGYPLIRQRIVVIGYVYWLHE